ncbi:MAG: 2-hydroxyacid dehydrogenase, partial [Actinomycetota bacterium]|nr:2-hydroxyacid dehydrogenase [Actinomycetota bacterium]
MRRDRLVAVSFPVNDEYAAIAERVLADDAELAFLSRLSAEDRDHALARADALIGLNLARELPAGGLAAAARLRFIQLLSAGADRVDFGALPEGAVLAGNVGAYARPMAEHVLAMTLALARRLPQRHAGLARGEFDQAEPVLTLDGAVCAILGFGGIGTATARLFRALGGRIHAVNTSGRTDEPADFIGTLADLDKVLADADVLVIALPLTRVTRGLIGTRELALMKPSAIMVNVARGAIVDQRALYERLRDYPDFCAGLDAWWHEPSIDGGFRTDFPFFDLPNLLGSPHNSG